MLRCMDVDFRCLLAGLLRAGLSQPQIAERASCGQSTISDLLRGSTKEPRFGLGTKLLQLAREHGVEPAETQPKTGLAADGGERHAA